VCLSGLASVLFAFMLMLRHAMGTLALVWIIAGYAFIRGAFPGHVRIRAPPTACRVVAVFTGDRFTF
jgi:hypothetical protein